MIAQIRSLREYVFRRRRLAQVQQPKATIK